MLDNAHVVERLGDNLVPGRDACRGSNSVSIGMSNGSWAGLDTTNPSAKTFTWMSWGDP